MNEIGLRIIADAALFHGDSGLAEFAEGVSGQADINSLSDHVQAVFGHAPGVGLQFVVGGGRTIAGNDFKRCVTRGFALQSVENVKQPRVNGFDFAGSMVPQQVIDLLQLFRQVCSILPIDDFTKVFTGMGVVERQAATGRAGKAGQCRPGQKHAAGDGQACF